MMTRRAEIVASELLTEILTIIEESPEFKELTEEERDSVTASIAKELKEY